VATDRAPVASELRRHRRFSLKCPASLQAPMCGVLAAELEVIDVSRHGFLARASSWLPEQVSGAVRVALGVGKIVTEMAVAVRCVRTPGGPYYGFHIEAPGIAWQQCIAELETSDAPRGAGSQRSGGALPEDWSLHDALTA
jgi:hypothetical protein